MYRCIVLYGPFFLGSVLATPIEIEIAHGDWLFVCVGKVMTLSILCGLYWHMVDSRRNSTS